MSIKKLAIALALVSLLVPLASSAQSSQSSSSLHDGDRVEAVVRLNVRATPSTSGTSLGKVPVGTKGTIKCTNQSPCPATASGYTWWYVEWDGAGATSYPRTGWSAEGISEADFLVKVGSVQSFQNGDRVKSSVNLRIRQTPSTAGTIVGTAPVGSTGTIACNLAGSSECPTDANGYTWWYIDWDGSIPTGWSVEGTSEAGFLSKVDGSVINSDGLSIITPTLPGATVGQPYSASVSATGGTGSYSWSITSGSLPPGLFLQNINCMTIGNAPCQVPIYVIGTPTTAGTYTFTMQLSVGDTGSVTKTFVIGVSQSATQQGGTGSGRIQATNNGIPWTGAVTLRSVTPDGTVRTSTITVPTDYPNVPVGNYSFSNITSGPSANPAIIVTNGLSCGTGCGTLTAANTSSNLLTFTLAFGLSGGTTPPPVNCPVGFTCTPIGGTTLPPILPILPTLPTDIFAQKPNSVRIQAFLDGKPVAYGTVYELTFPDGHQIDTSRGPTDTIGPDPRLAAIPVNWLNVNQPAGTYSLTGGAYYKDASPLTASKPIIGSLTVNGFPCGRMGLVNGLSTQTTVYYRDKSGIIQERAFGIGPKCSYRAEAGEMVTFTYNWVSPPLERGSMSYLTKQGLLPAKFCGLTCGSQQLFGSDAMPHDYLPGPYYPGNGGGSVLIQDP